uniref:uncharacterized protein LOC100180433 isoform X5 n=1 Tax=Ciona intestinalis TaxID=7719 RepID=UPI000EF4F025|nr:uncharacterized protein LOC100180433 isoform X5 [Ciona intestinalis]|eukprot:XP_026691499.1 uncharacterized protein LOC100180433 isoform X5 [Ciona intestinalis]
MMEAISEHGSDSLQNSEFDSLGPSPTRNGSEKGNAPKVPKRRSTMKRVASRIQRATSSSSLWGQNNSPVTVDIPTDGEVFQSVVETDGIFKSKEKSKKVAPEIKLTTAADASPTNVVSPKKKSRKGTMTNKMNPFGQRMRRSKSVIEETTIAHQQIAVPIISDELNYQEIAEELKQNELEVNEDRKRAPTQSWVMEVEYGKADIDSVEYGHDIIIQEIESGFFLGPVLRAVYEGNDHAKFLDRLDCRIKQHDRDIERMCNFHYQGFIESITELINVRSDAERLKNQTLIINKELQESGKEVARKSDDLIQCQLQQRNVASAIEKLSMCLPVLQMYAKMCEQMKAGRYYSALKTLEQLEHTHLPLIFQYRFCEIMKNNIPKIREEIKDVSMKELKDFLESVRKNSDKIGMVAMKQVEKERGVHLVSNQQSDKSVSEDESPAEADLPAYDYKDRLRQQKLAQNKLSNVVNGESKWTTANVNQSASPKPQRKLNPFEDISDGEDDKDERNPFENSNPFSTSDNPVDTNPFSVEEHVPLVKPRAGTYVNHSLVDEFTTGADMNSENDGKYEAVNPFLTVNQESGNPFLIDQSLSNGAVVTEQTKTESHSNPLEDTENVENFALVIVDKNANGGNPFKIEKSDENPFETEGSVHNPFSGSSNSHNPFETKSGIENVVDKEEKVINPFKTNEPTVKELKTKVEFNAHTTDTEDSNPFLQTENIVNQTEHTDKVDKPISMVTDTDVKEMMADIPPPSVKAPPRRRKKRALIFPPGHEKQENSTENQEQTNPQNGDLKSAHPESHEVQVTTETSKTEEFPPAENKQKLSLKNQQHLPDESCHGNGNDIQHLSSAEVFESDNVNLSHTDDGNQKEYEFVKQGENGVPVYDLRHKEIQEKRAKLTEDMLSPKWRKINEWNMPRIYQVCDARRSIS